MLAWRSYASLAILLVAMTGLVCLSRQSEPDVRFYVLLLSGSAALITLLLWRWPVASAALVFVGAALAHGISLAGLPAFEDDHYRFIWDGWRVIEAGTPYGISPEAFFTDTSVPLSLLGMLDSINNPEYPTIYGPVLQLLFAATFALFNTDALGLQLLFAGANLALVALMLRRYAPGRVALFAWNPLVIAETSLHLHPDGLLALALFAAVLAGQRRPVMAGLLLAAAAGVKLVALAAWPMLFRLRPAALLVAAGSLGSLYLAFLVQGRGAGFDSTATFAAIWHFNPLAYEPLRQLFGWQTSRVLALVIAGTAVVLMHARSRTLDEVPLAAIFGAILLFSPAVNSWYLLWLLPFAVNRGQLWPFAAAVALPFSYLTGINLGDGELEAFAVHPLARGAEWAILIVALALDWQRAKLRRATPIQSLKATPISAPRIAVIMPALNESASVGAAVEGIMTAMPEQLQQVIVVDNGSSDDTATQARKSGATVVAEPHRGYGAACLAGLAALDQDIEIVVFMDSDGSDVASDAVKIIAPIVAGQTDLVIGSRALGHRQDGAMSPPQRFGNWLAPLLVKLIWGVRYTDLGPFRAIRRDSLERLAMQDLDFGWTIEMQVRAAKIGLRIAEVPTDYRRRIGVSKISGTVKGVVQAGAKILFVIAREAFGDFDGAKERRASRSKAAVSPNAAAAITGPIVK